MSFGVSGRKKLLRERLQAVEVGGIATIEKKILKSQNTVENFDTDDGSVSSLQTATLNRAGRADQGGNLSLPKVLASMAESKFCNDAINKLTVKAKHFSKARDGDLLKAFETSSLDHTNFRIMLKRVFNLDFTNKEWKEVINLFDRNNDGDVDGDEFLTVFSILKTLAMNRESEALKERTMLATRKANKAESMAETQRNAKSENVVNFNFKEESVVTATKKVHDAARKFDKSHPSSMNLSAFDVKFLTPGMFREVVKLTFGLVLNPKELGVVIKKYDPSNSGVITSAVFLTQFLRLGIELRAEEYQQQLNESRQAEAELKAFHERKIQDLARKADMGVDLDFCRADEKLAFDLLHEAAFKYDRGHPSAMSLDGFKPKHLAPGEFKDALKSTFKLLMTGKQLGSLVKHFGVDVDGSLKVVSNKFVLYFVRHGIKARQSAASSQLEKQRNETKAREEEQVKLLEKAWRKSEFGVLDFEAGTVDAVEQKFRTAAQVYSKARGSSLEALEVSKLDAGVFQVMCRRLFDLKFSNTEMAAVLSMFPIEGESNFVDCPLFLNTFTKWSFEEKEKKRTEELRIMRELEALNRMHNDKVSSELGEVAERETVDFTFSEKDKKTAVRKLEIGASNFDRSHPSSMSMDAFLVSKMSPATLKRMLKNVFLVDLTPKETGAVVRQFRLKNSIENTDSDKDADSNDVNVHEFLLHFLAMSRKHKSNQRSARIESERNIQRRRQQEEKASEEKKNNDFSQRLKYTLKDSKLLEAHLKSMTLTYCADSASYLQHLQALKGPPTTAPAFRDIIYRVFSLRLSMPEVGSLMDVLDPVLAKEFMLDGAEFLRAFMRVSRLQEQVLLGERPPGSVTLKSFKRDGGSNLPTVITKAPSSPKLGKQKTPGAGGGFLASLVGEGGRNPWKDLEYPSPFKRKAAKN
jgi:Ca2+-binding EF-hand superfamily protein